MATQNAIDTNKPIGVDDGGTGAETLLDGGVLVGSGTGAITALSVGGTGEILVGTVGSDPAFATSADGNFTFTSASAGVTRILTVENTNNSSTASRGRINVAVGGASSGDPQLNLVVTGQTTFAVGIDNSDDDKFKIAASATLGTTDVLVATLDGEVTMPLQPAFLAVLSGQDANVTGDNTVYSYVCDSEIFDQNGDYNNSTGVFTAPVTGRYAFTASAYLSDSTTANLIVVQVVTSNRAYVSSQGRPASSQDLLYQTVCFVDMDASDTAHATVAGNGEGADTLDLEGTSGSDERTTFSGYLVC